MNDFSASDDNDPTVCVSFTASVRALAILVSVMKKVMYNGVTIEFHPTHGVRLWNGVDPLGVSMLDICLPVAWFDRYDCVQTLQMECNMLKLSQVVSTYCS